GPIGTSRHPPLDSINPIKILALLGDIRQYAPAQQPSPKLYMAYEQHPFPPTHLSVVLRTALEPTLLSEAVRQKANEESVDVPVKFTTMEASLAGTVAAPRFRTLLIGIFAGLAVCLGMAGVYGV